jgi:uncharacterized membrane protein
MEKNTKLLGGIAYIAMIVLAFIPFIKILSLAAAICVLIAFVQAGNQVGRPDVKTNIITAIVLYIVAMVLLWIMAAIGIAGVVANANHLSHANDADLSMLFAGIGGGMIAVGIIGWVLSIIATWFWYKASVALTEGTGVNLFKVGGLLLFLGAILLIVFGIGAIVMLVGEIIQCVAFFFSPEKQVGIASEPPTGAA